MFIDPMSGSHDGEEPLLLKEELHLKSAAYCYTRCVPFFKFFTVIIYAALLAFAAVISIRVDLKILDNAAEVQSALAKMQAAFSILHTLVCANGTFPILTPQE